MTPSVLVVLLGCAAASLSPSLLRPTMARRFRSSRIVALARTRFRSGPIRTRPTMDRQGGQFWIVLGGAAQSTVPAGTHATVSVNAAGAGRRAAVDERPRHTGDTSSQYAGLVTRAGGTIRRAGRDRRTTRSTRRSNPRSLPPTTFDRALFAVVLVHRAVRARRVCSGRSC